MAKNKKWKIFERLKCHEPFHSITLLLANIDSFYVVYRTRYYWWIFHDQINNSRQIDLSFFQNRKKSYWKIALTNLVKKKLNKIKNKIVVKAEMEKFIDFSKGIIFCSCNDLIF